MQVTQGVNAAPVRMFSGGAVLKCFLPMFTMDGTLRYVPDAPVMSDACWTWTRKHSSCMAIRRGWLVVNWYQRIVAGECRFGGKNPDSEVP